MLTNFLQKELIKEICRANYVDIVIGSLSSDHVHLLLSVLPSVSISKVLWYIKGKSGRKLLQEFAHLRKSSWGHHLWARGYFAVTVCNVNEQERHHKDDNFRISHG